MAHSKTGDTMSTYREALQALGMGGFRTWLDFREAFTKLKDGHRQEFINALITEQKILRARETEARK